MPAVLITGATGKQGGSLIRNLVARRSPLEILAVTRNAHSPSAQKLMKLSSNIKLVEGNLDDPAALFKNARQVTQSAIWGVYSVQVRVSSQFYQKLSLIQAQSRLQLETVHWRRHKSRRSLMSH